MQKTVPRTDEKENEVQGKRTRSGHKEESTRQICRRCHCLTHRHEKCPAELIKQVFKNFIKYILNNLKN
jgi:hypothetical protein